MSFSPLSTGDPAVLPLQASKWLDLQLLIDSDEMKTLFQALEPFAIYTTGRVCALSEGEVSHAEFLQAYDAYVAALQQGQLPVEQEFRALFSSVFTRQSDHLFQVLTADGRRIIRVAKPVLQLQLNKIAYSTADGKFRGMVFGKDSIFWGLQFSYPQLFLDSVTKEVFQVKESLQFPNTSLYRLLQRWVRQYTVPTPFQVADTQVNVPIRLGKNCFSWINKHIQLVQQNIKVREP